MVVREGGGRCREGLDEDWHRDGEVSRVGRDRYQGGFGLEIHLQNTACAPFTGLHELNYIRLDWIM